MDQRNPLKIYTLNTKHLLVICELGILVHGINLSLVFIIRTKELNDLVLYIWPEDRGSLVDGRTIVGSDDKVFSGNRCCFGSRKFKSYILSWYADYEGTNRTKLFVK